MYVIKKDGVLEQIEQIDSKLGLIEVKGDSVAQLWAARMMLKEVYGLIEKVDDKEEENDS